MEEIRMKKPLVSVLITTYNHEAWIEACLESVLNQKNVNIEILVHDDNSSDSTGKILEKYAGQCTIVSNKTGINLGVSRSFNKIMDLASGEYISIISGDDCWHEEKLLRQVDFMEINKSCDICFTDSITLDSVGKHGLRNPVFIYTNLHRKQWIHRLIFSNCLLASSAILRNSGWVRNNRMNVNMRQLQDWDYWIRAICSGLNFHIIEAPLTYYRVLANSISNEISLQKNSRSIFESIDCLKSFQLLHLAELREVFGKHIEQDPLFIKDRSIQMGLSIIMRLIGNVSHRRAAADLLHARFASGISNISDHEYQDFIGNLNL
jgi:glycosyltransferase involved in cell wall biosynthesis